MTAPVEWAEVFGLPAAARADRAVPKTQIVARGGLTSPEARKLDGLQTPRLLASLTKATTRMPGVRDAEHDVRSVLYLGCELKEKRCAPAELAQLLHKAFPHPTVVLLSDAAGNVGVSVAVKRLSQARRDAVVVEAACASGLFAAEDARYAGYLRALRYEALDQTDLLAYARSAVECTQLARAVEALGFYPACEKANRAALMGQVEKLQALQLQIDQKQALRRGAATTLAESARARVELRDLERQRQVMVERIKELCDE